MAPGCNDKRRMVPSNEKLKQVKCFIQSSKYRELNLEDYLVIYMQWGHARWAKFTMQKFKWHIRTYSCCMLSKGKTGDSDYKIRLQKHSDKARKLRYFDKSIESCELHTYMASTLLVITVFRITCTLIVTCPISLVIWWTNIIKIIKNQITVSKKCIMKN